AAKAPAAPPAEVIRQLDPGAIGVPAWLWSAHLAPVDVELASAEVYQGGRRFLAHGTVTAGPRGDGAVFRLRAAGKAGVATGLARAPYLDGGHGTPSLPLQSARADLELASAASSFGGPWSANGHGDAVMANDARVEAHLTLAPEAAGTLHFAVRA